MWKIICKGLALGYEGRAVCSGIDITIGAGDYLCVVGDNGSGKSTLTRALLGLVAPMEGEIIFDGVSRADIGYLPQRAEGTTDFPATVLEVVRSGCVGHRSFKLFMTKEQKERVERNMRCMRITDLAKKSFSTLSGGQQQRTLLARALCSAESVLILDEPTAGLDPKATEDTYRAVEHLNRDHGITIIMVTHDMEAVKKYATRVLDMSDDPSSYESVGEFFCEERRGEEADGNVR